jgi:type II secretory pathway pseudopilin PulG
MDMASRQPNGRPGGAGRRGGFTLVELLTIIIILSMLISLTTPSILKAREIFKVNQTRATIGQLEAGCRQYRMDWEANPPSGTGRRGVVGGLRGRYALVQALLGYRDDDGITGLGARKRTRGKVKGPYVKGQKTSDKPGKPPAFVDAFGSDVYYYRWEGDHEKGRFNEADNADGPSPLGVYVKDPNDDYYRQDYLLLSRGPDRAWLKPGPNVRKTDDLANFPFRFEVEDPKKN